MSSSKNHTKNELARISAKIHELKRKYPVSQELYMSQQKNSDRLDRNALQEIKFTVNNFAHTDQKMLRPKSISQNVRNNPKNGQTKQIVSNIPYEYQSSYRESSSQKSFYCEQNSPNKKINNNLQSHQSSSAQSQSFQMNFMRQKPFKQYKEELKNLKKQILSGLDFTNFPLKRQYQIKNPNVKNQQNIPFNKSTSQEVQRNLRQSFDKENLNQFNEPAKEKIQEQKNRPIQNRNKKYLMDKQNFQTNDNTEMKESIKILFESLSQQKLQFQQKISAIQFHSKSLHDQNEEIREQMKLVSEKLQQALKPSTMKLSQYDLKVVQMQNQSINKLTKDIYKELQTINFQLNNIKSIQFSSVKSDSSIQKNQIQQILIKGLQNNSQKMSQISEQRGKQIQSRFFREIFDLKNQIQLLNEKLKKEDYLQKALKQLLPTTNRNKEEEISEIISKVKLQLSRDNGFLNNLYSILQNSFDKKIPDLTYLQIKIQQVDQNLSNFGVISQKMIAQQSKKVKDEIGNFVLNELGYFSSSLKQFETKMTSYGILIEHLEETMNEISTQINCIVQVKSKQKDNLHIKSKQIISAQTQNFNSRSLTSIQNHQIQAHKSEYAKSQLQNSKFSQITLPYCHVQDIKRPEDQFFITKMGQSKISQIKHCHKGFLLEDLVKNSLVFGALNN